MLQPNHRPATSEKDIYYNYERIILDSSRNFQPQSSEITTLTEPTVIDSRMASLLPWRTILCSGAIEPNEVHVAGYGSC